MAADRRNRGDRCQSQPQSTDAVGGAGHASLKCVQSISIRQTRICKKRTSNHPHPLGLRRVSLLAAASVGRPLTRGDSARRAVARRSRERARGKSDARHRFKRWRGG